LKTAEKHNKIEPTKRKKTILKRQEEDIIFRNEKVSSACKKG